MAGRMSETERIKLHELYMREGSYAEVARQSNRDWKTIKDNEAVLAERTAPGKATNPNSSGSGMIDDKEDSVKHRLAPTGDAFAKYAGLREKGKDNIKSLIKLGLASEVGEYYEGKYQIHKFGRTKSAIAEKLARANFDDDEKLAEIIEAGSVQEYWSEINDLRRQAAFARNELRKLQYGCVDVSNYKNSLQLECRNLETQMLYLKGDVKRKEDYLDRLSQAIDEMDRALKNIIEKFETEKDRQANVVKNVVTQMIADSIQYGVLPRAIVYSVLDIGRKDPSFFSSMMYHSGPELMRAIASGVYDYLIAYVMDKAKRNGLQSESGFNIAPRGNSTPQTSQKRVEEIRSNRYQQLIPPASNYSEVPASLTPPAQTRDLPIDIFAGESTEDLMDEFVNVPGKTRMQMNPRPSSIAFRTQPSSAGCEGTGNQCQLSGTKKGTT